jgi:hypothetical protein
MTAAESKEYGVVDDILTRPPMTTDSDDDTDKN